MQIYKIENLINNKIYVGKQKNNNPNYFGSGILINRALKKYGKNNFKKIILEECDEQTVNEKEKYWIKTLNSLVPNGYNLTLGGDGGNTWMLLSEEKRKNASKKLSFSLKGKKHSELTKKTIGDKNRGKIFSEQHRLRLSESHKGKSLSEETKVKIRKKLKGRESPTKGMVFSNTTKFKMRNAHLGRLCSYETKRKIGLANSIKRPERMGNKHPNFKQFCENYTQLLIDIYAKNSFEKTYNILKQYNLHKGAIKRKLAELNLLRNRKNRLITEEWKNNVSNSLKGREITWNDKISQSLKNHSEEASMPNQIPNIRKRMETLKDIPIQQHIKLPLTGNDIQEIFHLKQGKIIGILLKKLENEYFGNPKMTKKQAIAFVGNVLNKMNYE